MARIRSLRQFIGDRLEDCFDATKRGVKQGARASKKGSAYNVSLSMGGVLDANIVEDSTRSADLEIDVRPSAALQSAVDGSAGADVSLGSSVRADSVGGINWSVSVTIKNAAALAEEDEEAA